MADQIEIEILEDGTIKTLTSKVSAANHQNADQFLRAMGRLAGGAVVKTKRPDSDRIALGYKDPVKAVENA